MAFFGYTVSKKVKHSPKGYAEQDNTGEWFQYFKQFVDNLGNDKLLTYRDICPYDLATTIAEIYIPIDAIADRAAGIKYDLVDANGEPYEAKGNLKKLIEQPNPFDSLSDIVYQSVFSELADGNSYIYTKTPESRVNPTVDNISNIWVLKPNVTEAVLLKEISNPFLMKDKSDLIAFYKTFFMLKFEIEPRYILHTTALGMDERCKGISPLSRAQRNINNILAVYHARYNVYAKNGMGGILTAAPRTATGNIQDVIDPVTRDDMQKDLMNRNGLTGDKNFIGMSATPMQFLKTLGTISELQPFDETEENAIKIAGIYGVDPELIPRRGSSTFTNKNDAEKSLWQNVVKSICEDKANDLTKAYYLPEGIRFKANFDSVEALQEDKKTALESDGIYIDNLAKLKEAGQEVTIAYKNITDKYNG